MSAADTRYMGTALALGRRGMGQCAPNPAVGCVIVKNGRIVGRGWTSPGGRPHAEPQALARAGDAARGATVYVTLEPCAHHGHTPPCADALIAAGVARVVAPFEDTDARVSGRGFRRLREAGIEVTTGVMVDAAARDLAGFLMRNEIGRPRVTLKLASSLDGRIATATGHSQWITGAQARRVVHSLRARHDAVMVGAGTARADDPMLTVRGMGAVQQPVRVVVSRRLDVPLMSGLARSAAEVPVWLCHGPDVDDSIAAAWRGTGARLMPCAVTAGQVDPASVLQALGRAGITRVLCEGGGSLAASFLGAGLVDEFVGFTAGLAIGAEGLPGIGALGLASLDEVARFSLAETQVVGDDVMHRWERSAA